MEIDFAVGNMPVKLVRDWFTGTMRLVLPDRTVWLQHPLRLGTHFSIALTRQWRYAIDGHDVLIEKKRTRLLAGVRAQSYRICVDGEVVASSAGI